VNCTFCGQRIEDDESDEFLKQCERYGIKLADDAGPMHYDCMTAAHAMDANNTKIIELPKGK
jgi:hypothetical protein